MIVQELQKIQERCGWLPAEELRALSQRLTVPLHRLHEVASYYPLYRLKPPPRVDVKICRDMACHMAGAERVRAEVEMIASEYPAGSVAVDGVSCLGRCDKAVAAAVNDHHYVLSQTSESLRQLISKAYSKDPLPHAHWDMSPLGLTIDVYNGRSEYLAVKRWFEGMEANALLKELEVSGLRGMGGAGFPTFRKWMAVRGAPGQPKYVVCNADESEPGTFKDRELLRRAPWLVIEGMVLAALVVGAEKGWIYIRHEYPDGIDAVRAELKRAREAGIIGSNILGKGKTFELDIFISPGGYVQGEESALLEAMEDRRGEPRNKPPFPVFQGLYGKPTVINNVETLSWVPGIVLHGGSWYRDMGVRGATGMRLVSISGDVAKPGVYEAPLGQTLRELIELAGGMAGGRPFKAVALSGPSGGFYPAQVPVSELPPKFVQTRMPAGTTQFDMLDLALDFTTCGEMGAMLGAACIVYNDTRDMVNQALNAVSFYRNESCGKCVPCRVGGQKMVEMTTELVEGRSPPGRLELMRDLGETMGLTSICGLGQVASNPVTSVLKLFPEEVEAYRKGQKP
ncbi:MAG: NADH-ubiquinone oxidoreductase-F iron-sulfur binding region domain-containing protein [Planctomycetota bacterium]|jgi:NADH:ubiquinone oxidoreductase subunit F (NADH-binding)/NADH:ubiquinone oxidoreductase subunit E